MLSIELTFDGCLPDRAIHALDRASRPRMVAFGRAVFDLACVADHAALMHSELGVPAIPVSRLISALDATIGLDDVDFVGNRLHHGLKEGHSDASLYPFIEPGYGKLRCVINSYEHVEFALT